MAETPKRPTGRTEPRPPPPKHGGAVADELRMRIDAGQTGDKVDHPDPAAAPLGTDAEAGGTPTDPEAMRRAAAKETARTPLAQDRPDPRTLQARSARNRMIALLALVIVLGLLVLIWA